jgi:hypothetical protein
LVALRSGLKAQVHAVMAKEGRSALRAAVQNVAAYDVRGRESSRTDSHVCARLAEPLKRHRFGAALAQVTTRHLFSSAHARLRRSPLCDPPGGSRVDPAYTEPVPPRVHTLPVE